MTPRIFRTTLLAFSIAALSFSQERSQSGLDFEGARPMLSQPERTSKAMIASAHELATAAGLGILKKGGNAVDAAVAVGFALAVVHPEAGNLGGGGYMVVRMADGRAKAFDFKETIPAATKLEAFPDSSKPYVGFKTAGVPGTVAGLAMAHKRFGKLPWATVLEPARQLAERGFPSSQRMEIVLKLQAPVMKDFPEAARIFQHGSDKPLRQGELLKQPDLAATIRRIQKNGAQEFYEGQTAKMIAADMKVQGGFMTLDDLRNYKAIEEEPITGTYRGNRILTMPPSSSGGFVLLEMLNMLERFPMELGMEGSSASKHLIVEAMRRGFRDRLLYAADPKVAAVPLDKLLSAEYADREAASIKAHAGITPAAELPNLEGPGTVPAPWADSPHTTHFSIVDQDGNLVSNTYTLGSFYGSQAIPKGTGVLLGDMVGTIASGAKAIERSGGRASGRPAKNPLTPGTRLVSTMSPCIMIRPDGTPWVAFGTPGGATIPSTLLQIVLNLVDYKMPLRDAIEYPRIHEGFSPDRIESEPGALVRDVADTLTAAGYQIDKRLRSQGDVHAVAIEEKTGMRLGWSDGRRGGRAGGY